MKRTVASKISHEWATQRRGRIAVALALTLLRLGAPATRADTVYVWCGDGTIRQYSTNGVGSVLASNVSGWNGPVGLAVDGAGALYSGCPGNSTITKYTTNGGNSVAGFPVDSVSALAFDHNGKLYATIPNYHEVSRLAHGGFYGYYLSILEYRSQSHLSWPTSLAIHPTRGIFIANGVAQFPGSNSAYTNTIARFSFDLTHLEDFATNLMGPWGLAFDRAGDLFVSNSGEDVIYRFTPDGVAHIFAMESGLSTPKGITFDSSGVLYVANAGTGTIQRFTPNGHGTVIVANLNSPTSLAVHPGLGLWKTPALLSQPQVLPAGGFQFSFNHMVGAGFSVWAATNPVGSPGIWSQLGGATEIWAGQFEFIDWQATNFPKRFYRVAVN